MSTCLHDSVRLVAVDAGTIVGMAEVGKCEGEPVLWKL
jgi:hypothetical protein